MQQYPECQYRYKPMVWELCNYGNENLPPHKKHIEVCCANACPLGRYPESEKITTEQAYERDMKKIDAMNRRAEQ